LAQSDYYPPPSSRPASPRRVMRASQRPLSIYYNAHPGGPLWTSKLQQASTGSHSSIGCCSISGAERRACGAAKYQFASPANLGFNARHQEICVQRWQKRVFYQLLHGARPDRCRAIVPGLSPSRFRRQPRSASKLGLATAPDVSQARQQAAQAAFDIEAVQSSKSGRRRACSLARSHRNHSDNTFPSQGFLEICKCPANLEDSVETVIDRSPETKTGPFGET